MPRPSDAASLLTELSPDLSPEALAERIAMLEEALADAQKHVATLMAEEKPGEGIFRAAEIHEAKQNLMMLRYQRDLCVARRNRALL